MTPLKSYLYVFLLLPLLFTSTACKTIPVNTNPDESVVVKSVEIALLESFPVQVNVFIEGDLSGDCSQLNLLSQERDINTREFHIKLTATQMQGENCSHQPVPFEKTVSLDVVNLPAGTYTVDVNGTTAAFTLDVDNTVPDDTDSGEADMANPASKFCENQGFILEIRTGVDNGQYGVCKFPDGSECDEWAFFRGECQFGKDISDWPEYTNPEYGFSFRIPLEWSLEEVQDANNTMYGHQVKLLTEPEANVRVEIIINFKQVGEDQIIWPTGVGDGEFVMRNTAKLIGKPVNRNVLVCEDQDMSIYYQQDGGVVRGDLEFAIILRYVGNCTDGYSIPIDIQTLADVVVSSIRLLQENSF